MKATMTLMGMYDYDNSIFDNLHLPSGLDRENVLNTILLQCAELELVFTSPLALRWSIGTWSKHRLDSWQKLYNTTQIEYNPIENYNRKEEWTDSGNGSGTGSQTAFDSRTMQDVSGSRSDYASKHIGHAHGNIGVTTTQQMLERERTVVNYDLVQTIADEFKNYFCLLVY